MTELQWRATSREGAGLEGDLVLEGQVDERLADGSIVLGRSVPGRCCGLHAERVGAIVSGIPGDAAPLGTWLTVAARWEPGTGRAPGEATRCTASSWSSPAVPPPRDELCADPPNARDDPR